MLYLIRDNPTLLDPAPHDWDVQAMERRRDDEVHKCFRCWGRSRMPLVVETSEGPRWLDVCFGCYHEVWRANAEADLVEGTGPLAP